MKRLLLYILFAVCVFSIVKADASEAGVFEPIEPISDELDGRTTPLVPLQVLEKPLEAIKAYYRFLKRQVHEIDTRELKVNHGVRLPILCSVDDYFYSFAHILPAKIKTLLLETSTHAPTDHSARHELFYTTFQALPPNVQASALEARHRLEMYVKQVALPMDTLLLPQQQEWDALWQRAQQLVDQVAAQPVAADDLQQAWQDHKRDAEALLRHQLAEYDTWRQTTDRGFVEVVTTMGALRHVVEAIYIDALHVSMDTIQQFARQNRDLMQAWLDTFWAQVQLNRDMDATTVELNPEVATTCEERLTQATQQRPSLSRTRYEVDRAWNQMANDIAYSKWHWLYWSGLWHHVKAIVTRQIKALIKTLDRMVPDQ
ncbi:hypothetical protein BC940DRAFT_348289 [Gongronella butleri]|nr:hypothetical protein BC940DRAFT_348289 [Gongronella butleri]